MEGKGQILQGAIALQTIITRSQSTTSCSGSLCITSSAVALIKSLWGGRQSTISGMQACVMGAAAVRGPSAADGVQISYTMLRCSIWRDYVTITAEGLTVRSYLRVSRSCASLAAAQPVPSTTTRGLPVLRGI